MAPATSTQVDNYTTRIVKYIPAEIIAFYIAADRSVKAASDESDANALSVFIKGHLWFFSMGVFLIALFGVPLYYYSASEKSSL